MQKKKKKEETTNKRESKRSLKDVPTIEEWFVVQQFQVLMKI